MLSVLLSILTTIMVTLKTGDTAPNFTAVSTNGSNISLSDYKGKSNVILYFYPEDMTHGCTIEACHFRDDKSKFEKLNTVILGVSMDDRNMHQQFTEKDRLNFPLLVDTSGAICKEYGVPFEDHWARRWTFLIDKEGKIAKIYTKVNPQEHSDELQKDIEALPK